MKLGVNIDHIATLRQARGERYLDILEAAKIALKAGADGITVHLREDRRHIQDFDVFNLKKIVNRLNLEMSIEDEIVEIACNVKPLYCCLVPEKRQELTTEGGLDVISNFKKIKKVVEKLTFNGIKVSIFIDPIDVQIIKAKETGAQYIELHTGKYANSTGFEQELELESIKQATSFATKIGFTVNAGHGLNYENVKKIAQINEIQELNIGHSIISRSIFTGLKKAVCDMKKLLD